MSNPDFSKKTSELTDQEVADYLRDHPDFLIERPALLAEIELPHAGDTGATSLVERQVAILRERNIAMRHRVDQLLHTARRNDQLFEKTRKLSLALLSATSTGELIDALFVSFDQERSSMDTLFLSHIADIFSQCLKSRLMPEKPLDA